jgi:hypothetical protein
MEPLTDRWWVPRQTSSTVRQQVQGSMDVSAVSLAVHSVDWSVDWSVDVSAGPLQYCSVLKLKFLATQILH